MTRNASEAFAARSGNCLSLVIMTAAFAKALDLPVEYQKVFVDDAWARAGNIYLAIGHVNLTLGKRKTDEVAYASRAGQEALESEGLTIDFLPSEDMRSVRTRAIGEDIVVAMYMNNRAVEALARGRIDDAYWFAREAIGQSPDFLVAYNTLGAVYHKHGDLAQAEARAALRLEREPANTQAHGQPRARPGRRRKNEESERARGGARATRARAAVRASSTAGMAAMRAGDLHAAKASFAREVARSPDYHEFHFWLAVAHIGLGETDGGAQASRDRGEEQHDPQ